MKKHTYLTGGKLNYKNLVSAHPAPPRLTHQRKRRRPPPPPAQATQTSSAIIVKVIRMMSGSIRRKALSLCSSALANNGIVRSLERVEPASRGYVAGIPGFCRVPEYSKPLRDLRTDFSTPKWVRSFSSHSESTVSEPVAQFQTNKVRPGYFTASGAVIASGPIVNAPPAAKFGLALGIPGRDSPKIDPNCTGKIRIDTCSSPRSTGHFEYLKI
ncbi:hypothetical protein L1887_03435 [Cichorium endivia]|nr:hypothetical protein L1887_03435 [Cichorium endivia]